MFRSVDAPVTATTALQTRNNDNPDVLSSTGGFEGIQGIRSWSPRGRAPQACSPWWEPTAGSRTAANRAKVDDRLGPWAARPGPAVNRPADPARSCGAGHGAARGDPAVRGPVRCRREDHRRTHRGARHCRFSELPARSAPLPSPKSGMLVERTDDGVRAACRPTALATPAAGTT